MSGENIVFPDWVNTLVNGAIAGALVWGVVALGGLSERLAVLEKTVSQSIELTVQKQVTIDLKQDQTVALLDRRVTELEKAQRSLMGKARVASEAVETVSVLDPLSESTITF